MSKNILVLLNALDANPANIEIQKKNPKEIYDALISADEIPDDKKMKRLAVAYKDVVADYIRQLPIENNERKIALSNLFGEQRHFILSQFFFVKRGFFNPDDKNGTLGMLRREYESLNNLASTEYCSNSLASVEMKSIQ